MKRQLWNWSRGRWMGCWEEQKYKEDYVERAKVTQRKPPSHQVYLQNIRKPSLHYFSPENQTCKKCPATFLHVCVNHSVLKFLHENLDNDGRLFCVTFLMQMFLQLKINVWFLVCLKVVGWFVVSDVCNRTRGRKFVHRDTVWQKSPWNHKVWSWH